VSSHDLSGCIRYTSGYKYQLRRTHVDAVAIHPTDPIHTDYVDLDTDGTITLKRGYAWDGASGPSIDTPSFMRGSLVHDALYQLMRSGALDSGRWRDRADRELRRICREDGMGWLRSWCVYYGVRWFGEPSTWPSASRPIRVAPRRCAER